MKYFGTDGIRGKVGEHPITPSFFTKVAWAVGQVFRNETEHAKVLVGKDTRISGYMFESAMQAGLAAAGADTIMVGPMPTPAIAYLTRAFSVDVGVVISASHNGYEDNGVKFFSSNGTKLDDALERKIEECLEQDIEVVAADYIGRAARLVDARGRYIEFCKNTLPRTIKMSHKKLVIDCAHGATSRIAENVFSELGAEVVVINNSPDGMNINKNCGSTMPQSLLEATRKHKADMGIAFDGDGDRVAICNRRGELIDGDAILYIIAKYFQHRGRLTNNKVVGTIATNFGLEKSLGKLGIDLERVPVGDRHIIEALLKEDVEGVGGEFSGHIVCTRYSTTGDGIIAALQVLAALETFQCDFDPLIEEAGIVPATRHNIKFHSPQELLEDAEMQKTIVNLEKKINSEGRLLVRPSGTEPLLRVSIEAKDKELHKYSIDAIGKAVKRIELRN